MVCGLGLQLVRALGGKISMSKVRSGSDGRVTSRRKSQDRDRAESNLRKGGQHCPLCLALLPSIAGKGRSARKCTACGAQPHRGKLCSKCHQEAIWETSTKAACQACGQHGSKLTVVAATSEENWPRRRPDKNEQ